MKLKVLFIMLVMAFFADASECAVKKSEPKASLPDKTVVQDMPISSFDPKVTVLPANFTGTDIVLLYNKLYKAVPKKDEFETKDAYLKRVQDNLPGDLYAFVKVIDDNIRGGYFQSAYDPEKQSMKVTFVAYKYTNRSKGGLKGRVNVKMANARTEEHEASNRFGAKTMVTTRHGDLYAIELINGPFTDREISFKIPSEEAKSFKKNIGALILCKAKKGEDVWRGKNDPVISFASLDFSEATMDYPYENHYYEHSIYVEVYEIWIYDKKTGVIYAKDIIEKLPEA